MSATTAPTAPRTNRPTTGPRLLLVLALSSSACGDKIASTTDGDTTGATSEDTAIDPTAMPACTDPGPRIAVLNGTPWTLAALQSRPCDATDPFEVFPFPGGGLAPGATFEVPLAAPGCYELDVVDAGGCYVDPDFRTTELAACEVFDLELTEDPFVCPGVVQR